MRLIVRDIFPAQLLDPPAELDLPAGGRVRAVATVDGTLLLLIETGGGLQRRELPYDVDASELGQVWSARPARFVLTNGLTLDVRRGSGCGCGSRLRSIEPFPDDGPMTVAG